MLQEIFSVLVLGLYEFLGLHLLHLCAFHNILFKVVKNNYFFVFSFINAFIHSHIFLRFRFYIVGYGSKRNE